MGSGVGRGWEGTLPVGMLPRHPCILPGLIPNLAGGLPARVPKVWRWACISLPAVPARSGPLAAAALAGLGRQLLSSGIQQPSFPPLPATTLPTPGSSGLCPSPGWAQRAWQQGQGPLSPVVLCPARGERQGVCGGCVWRVTGPWKEPLVQRLSCPFAQCPGDPATLTQGPETGEAAGQRAGRTRAGRRAPPPSGAARGHKTGASPNTGSSLGGRVRIPAGKCCGLRRLGGGRPRAPPPPAPAKPGWSGFFSGVASAVRPCRPEAQTLVSG